MNENDLNLQTYSETMDRFLILLRSEVEEISRQFEPDSTASDNLDRYLLAVNSYYYRSFHETFWPEYQKKMKTEITQLLDLKIQGALLKKHIAAVIKRNAHLFNQVKSISTRLQQLKRKIMERKLSFIDEIDRQVLELLYVFKEIKYKLAALHGFIDSLHELSSDLANFQGPARSQLLMTGARALCSSNFKNHDHSNFYYQLLKQQQQIFNLIQKCSSDDAIMPERISKIRTLLSSATDWPQEEFALFYEAQIQLTALHYTELILLNLQLQDYPRLKEIILEFSEFWAIWLDFLELIISYMPQAAFHLIPDLYQLNHKNPEYLKELSHDLSSIHRNVEELGQDLDNIQSIDFVYFSKQLQNILEFSAPLYKTMAQESPVTELKLLSVGLQQLSLAFSLMDSRLRILLEEHGYMASIITHSEDLLNRLDSEIELLGNIKNDLERLLTARNLSRVWKGLDIRVTHIPLNNGQPLADKYLYLLDKYHINTRISGEIDNTILEEEGDIFIIRVEDEVSEEIPYLIIGKKG